MRSNVLVRKVPSSSFAENASSTSRTVSVTALWDGCVASAPVLRSPNALVFATHQALIEAGLISGGARHAQPRAVSANSFVFKLERGELSVVVRSLQRQCMLRFQLASGHPDELASAHRVIHAISHFLSNEREPVVSLRTWAGNAAGKAPAMIAGAGQAREQWRDSDAAERHAA